MSTIYAGTAVLSTATFTDPTGAVVDPTTVSLKYSIYGQAATTVTYGSGAITRVSTGVYQYTLDTSPGTGTWTLEWIGTGTCETINATTLVVSGPPL